jgi:catechol 2,3-dioxygenase-like lactoylglutathione lyase family enzyme
MDMKIELIPIPVSDPDASKKFYVEKCGFVEDHDHRVSDDLRFIQLTPPGSACSICFGEGLSEADPGSVETIQIVVDSAEEAKRELDGRGLDVGDVDDQPWGKFLYFKDPDGNGWAIQEIVIPGQS